MKERQNGGDGKELTWRGLVDSLMTEPNSPFKDRSWANSHVACLKRSANYDALVCPDVAQFIVDRVREKAELIRRFGCVEISLPQAAALLGAFSTNSRDIFVRGLKRKIFSEYPSMRKIINGQRKLNSEVGLPPHLFWEKLDEQFPLQNQREEVEKCIKKALGEYHISPTEYAVIIGLMMGKTNEEIGEKLKISDNTVFHHNLHIFSKLSKTTDCRGRQAAALFALKEGLFPAFLLPKFPVAKNTPFLNSLSERELFILALIKNGLSNKEIGQQLGVCHQTVKDKVTSLFHKINCHSRVEASILYYVASLQQVQV